MSKHKTTVPLAATRTGQWVKIVSMPKDGSFRAKFIRVGIDEGVKLECMERLPGGTVVLRKHRQQIAVGHQLAKEIMVVVLGTEGREEDHTGR